MGNVVCHTQQTEGSTDQKADDMMPFKKPPVLNSAGCLLDGARCDMLYLSMRGFPFPAKIVGMLAVHADKSNTKALRIISQKTVLPLCFLIVWLGGKKKAKHWNSSRGSQSTQ